MIVFSLIVCTSVKVLGLPMYIAPPLGFLGGSTISYLLRDQKDN